MTIACELTIIPAIGSRMSRYTLSVGSEVIFDKFEDDLTPTEKECVSMIAWGNSRQMGVISERLRNNQQ